MRDSANRGHTHGFFDFVRRGLPATSISNAVSSALGQKFNVQNHCLSDSEVAIKHSPGQNSVLLVTSGRASAQLLGPAGRGQFGYLASGDSVRLGDAEETGAVISTTGTELRFVKIDFPSRPNEIFRSKLVLVDSLVNEFVPGGVTEVTQMGTHDFRRVLLKEDEPDCPVPLRVTAVLLNLDSTQPHSHPQTSSGTDSGYQLYVFLDDSRHDVHLQRGDTGRNPDALTFQVYREAKKGCEQKYVAEPGDLLLIPHGIVHQVFGGLVAVVDFCKQPGQKPLTDFIKLRS